MKQWSVVSGQWLAIKVFLFFLLVTGHWSLVTISGSEAAKPRLSTVIIEGVATVIDGDITLAKDTAIKNAMRNAVENIVTGLIKETEELVMYKWSLEEGIYNNYEKFIQSYKILGDMQDKDTYSVTLQVNVFEDSIKKRLLSLGIASIESDNRRVLLIIEETTNLSLAGDNFLTFFSISEDVISKILTDAGFEIMNRASVRNRIDLEDFKKAITGEGDATYKIGKQVNANIMILGIAEIKAEIGSVKAELNTKVYSVKRETMIVERHEVTNVLTTDKILGTAQSLRSTAGKTALILIDFIKKELDGEDK